MGKVHHEVTVVEPSESDTEGYFVSLCGRDTFENGTTDKRYVTCKVCLKELSKPCEP